jgi:hypothetical protein
VSDIVAAAKPAFTKRKSGDPAEEGTVVQQQIAELQAAVSENATHIKELAEQLRLTIAAIDKGAADSERRISRAYSVAIAAVLLSIVSAGAALYALMN